MDTGYKGEEFKLILHHDVKWAMGKDVPPPALSAITVRGEESWHKMYLTKPVCKGIIVSLEDKEASEVGAIDFCTGEVTMSNIQKALRDLYRDTLGSRGRQDGYLDGSAPHLWRQYPKGDSSSSERRDEWQG